MSKIRLIEHETWQFKVSKHDLLSSLSEITGTPWGVDRKKKVNLYKGTVATSHFRISDNPSLGRVTTVSGSINRTVILGQLQDTSQGVELEIKAELLNFGVLSMLTAPFIVSLLILGNLGFTLLNSIIVLTLASLFELLVIRGFNSEIREALKKLKKRFEEIENTHYNNR